MGPPFLVAAAASAASESKRSFGEEGKARRARIRPVVVVVPSALDLDPPGGMNFRRFLLARVSQPFWSPLLSFRIASSLASSSPDLGTSVERDMSAVVLIGSSWYARGRGSGMHAHACGHAEQSKSDPHMQFVSLGRVNLISNVTN